MTSGKYDEYLTHELRHSLFDQQIFLEKGHGVYGGHDFRLLDQAISNSKVIGRVSDTPGYETYISAEELYNWSNDMMSILKGKNEINKSLTDSLEFTGSTLRSMSVDFISNIKASKREIDEVLSNNKRAVLDTDTDLVNGFATELSTSKDGIFHLNITYQNADIEQVQSFNTAIHYAQADRFSDAQIQMTLYKNGGEYNEKSQLFIKLDKELQASFKDMAKTFKKRNNELQNISIDQELNASSYLTLLKDMDDPTILLQSTNQELAYLKAIGAKDDISVDIGGYIGGIFKLHKKNNGEYVNYGESTGIKKILSTKDNPEQFIRLENILNKHSTFMDQLKVNEKSLTILEKTKRRKAKLQTSEYQQMMKEIRDSFIPLTKQIQEAVVANHNLAQRMKDLSHEEKLQLLREASGEIKRTVNTLK